MIALALKQQYTNITIGPDATYECVIMDGKIIHWNRPEAQPVEADVLAGYDALADDRANAITDVKTAQVAVYERYATSAPGKDSVYTLKYAEALAYFADSSVGQYMQARVDETAEDPLTIATEWKSLGESWCAIAAQADAINDGAVSAINASDDPQPIADAAVARLDEL